MPMSSKQAKIKQTLEGIGDYVQYALDALEKNDMDEVESNLSMIADDIGGALHLTEILVDAQTP